MPPYAYAHLRAKPKAKEPYYSASQYWTDVEPIALIEGPPQAASEEGEPTPPPPAPALATIAYSPRYVEAMSYLRAVMAANEFSERCLALTEDIIEQNPAHYTVWLYRMKCLRRLWDVNTDGPTPSFTSENEPKIIEGINRELEWLEGVSERNLKNYQIWYSPFTPSTNPDCDCVMSFPGTIAQLPFHRVTSPSNCMSRYVKQRPALTSSRHHRQSLLSLLTHAHPLPPTEIPFITHILSFDAKNYHVWTYRQWLCRHFASTLLPPGSSSPSPELVSLEQLLNEDCRNNSAWSHRYFVVFGHEELAELEKPGQKLVRKELLDQKVLDVDEEVVEREIAYTKGWIEVAPQNPSPWNYLSGVLRRAGRGLGSERAFCESFVRPNGGRHHQGSEDADEGNEDELLDFEGEAVRSSHAIDWLSQIYAQDGTDEAKAKARQCLKALGSKWDIIRKNYWDYRMRSI